MGARSLSPGWRHHTRGRTPGGPLEYKLDEGEVTAGRCHLFSLSCVKCKVTHFLLEVTPPLRWMLCIDLCLGGCASFTHPASTSSHLSPMLRWVSHSVHLSFQLLGMHRALLYLWHMPTWHPLPPALSMSLSCIFRERLSMSGVATCFGPLFSSLLFKSRRSCIRWSCFIVSGTAKQD